MSESWTELLDIVAHDLKTPITAVKGYIELIEQTGPLNDTQQRFADRAFSGLKRMEQLVTMLLDMTWIDADKPPELGEISLRELIEEAVEIQESIAEERSITITIKVTPNVGRVRADARRMSQVINNLLSNAIKYNRDGGAIEITGDGDATQVSISVRDTGIGIGEDELERVFERFFRARGSRATRVEGSGLGLAIVKAVVEKHNGTISLNSELGVGSTFTFTLPRAPLSREGIEMIGDLADPHRPLDSISLRDYTDDPTSASEEQDAVDDDMQESQELERPDQDGDQI